MSTDVRREIDWLFQRLLLTSPSPEASRSVDNDMEDAYRRVVRVLKADGETYDHHFELKLRLALHLAPASAISFNPSSTSSRNRLVRRFLEDNFGPSAEADSMSRAVAGVLNSWDSQRQAVHDSAGQLLKRQNGRCAHCHVQVTSSPGVLPNTTPVTVERKDEYKPLFESPEELLQAEVDHIEPVSRLGGNHFTNLQILCRYCNRGKGDRLGLDTRSEAKHAGAQVQDIPRAHKARVLYYVVARQERKCQQCGDAKFELSIRKTNQNGGFLRSNIFASCVRCLYPS